MQHQLQSLHLLQLNQVHRFQTQLLVQPVMTPLRLHLLIRKDHLKQLPLLLILQLRLPHLPVPWLRPLPLPPVLLPRPVLQLVLPVQQELPEVVQPVAVPVVAVDHHRLHQVRVDVQRVPKVARVKKAKGRASQNHLMSPKTTSPSCMNHGVIAWLCL
jgi:hypothetical protein